MAEAPPEPGTPAPIEEPSENPDRIRRGRSTLLHDLFGRHRPNLAASHWQLGYFVTTCTTCDRAMVKLPGLPWRLRALID